MIAPSLIPAAPGDRVKTDKRDCDAAVDAAESDLKVWYDREPFVEYVHRRGAYWGLPTWAR